MPLLYVPDSPVGKQVPVKNPLSHKSMKIKIARSQSLDIEHGQFKDTSARKENMEELDIKDTMEVLSNMQSLNSGNESGSNRSKLLDKSPDLHMPLEQDNFDNNDYFDEDADHRKTIQKGYYPKLDPPYDSHKIEPIGTNKPCAYCELLKRRTKNGWYVYSRFRCSGYWVQKEKRTDHMIMKTEFTPRPKGPKKTPMRRDDVKLLMSSSLLTLTTPIGLLRKVWFDLSLHLGVCGQDALRDMLGDSLLIETDEYGYTYCRLSHYMESNGIRSQNEMTQWDWNARMYEIPGDPNCPMASLNLYLSKRNPFQNALFQRPKAVTSKEQDIWYATPLGHCVLARLMSSLCEESRMDRLYTNSTIRVTAAELIEARGIPVVTVMNADPRSEVHVTETGSQGVIKIEDDDSDSSDSAQINWGVKLFRGWLVSVNLPVEFEIYTVSDLNDVLCQFYLEAKSKRGDPYQLCTLLDVKNALKRYLSGISKQWSDSWKDDRSFESSNRILDSIREAIKESTPRNKAPSKLPMTQEDRNTFIKSGLLCTSNPLGLFRKVWFDLSLHLGCGGQAAMRSLTADMFVTEIDEQNRRYYRLNKCSHVESARSKMEMQYWDWEGRMYEIPGDPNCPVSAMDLYLSKRNPHKNAFFQRPKTNIHDCPDVWYESQVGHGVLASIMSRMSEDAGLSRLYTNTSVRVTAAEALEKSCVNVDAIMGINPKNKTAKSVQQAMSRTHTSDELFFNSKTLHEILYGFS
ncbi:unnamed protein product [Mytilus edulis]|uniref:DUF3504 domain-containing protein n=1 Tax=Mytilus edulis TaxID=6550 RepID=A0A8S3UKH8_MYTED|nr:unnamed protein product [Mytilus edulis]